MMTNCPCDCKSERSQRRSVSLMCLAYCWLLVKFMPILIGVSVRRGNKWESWLQHTPKRVAWSDVTPRAINRRSGICLVHVCQTEVAIASWYVHTTGEHRWCTSGDADNAELIKDADATIKPYMAGCVCVSISPARDARNPWAFRKWHSRGWRGRGLTRRTRVKDFIFIIDDIYLRPLIEDKRGHSRPDERPTSKQGFNMVPRINIVFR